MKLSQMLDLSNKTPKRKTVDQHRNICVGCVWGCWLLIPISEIFSYKLI